MEAECVVDDDREMIHFIAELTIEAMTRVVVFNTILLS
jgi:hypothetical protein